MTQTYVTQCPHCGTTFKVTDSHLKAANGSVRCGACLRVFSAKNHLMDGDLPPTKRPAPKPKVAPEPVAKPASTQQYQEELPSFTADNDDDSEFLFATDLDDLENDNHALSEEDDFVFEDDPDEDLFEEEETDNQGIGDLSDELLNLSNPAHGQPSTSKKVKQETISDDGGMDEEWAQSLIEEAEQEGKANIKSFTQEHLSIAEDEAPQEQVFKTSGRTANANATQAIKRNLTEKLDQIEAAPVEIDFEEDEGIPKQRTLLWTCLTLVAGIALVIQFAWFNMNTLSREDLWRSYYLAVCQHLGCSLPAQENLSEIKASKVIRRRHPNNAEAIILDAILMNQATFDQPFPQLLVIFTDINGARVADQAFAPESYLSGEMAGATVMPSKRPVFVSMNLQNPGDSAVNYRVEFISTNP